MDGVPTDLIRREGDGIGLGDQIAGAARVDNSGIFADARTNDYSRVFDFVPLKQALQCFDRKLADGKS